MPDSQVKAGVPESDQADVYKIVGVPQLDSMFEGYNGCIFAYGQTSSGKTHTMMGTEGEGRGVTPRLCEELFVRIAQKESLPDDLKKTTYSVKISFLEIYNEKVQDLLSKKSTGHDLKIVHDPLLGPVVKGLTEHVVTTWDEVNRLLLHGMHTRTTASTAMNDASSRSHAVVQISLDMEDALGVVGMKRISRQRRSRANLVDLAGSEKVSKSKVEGANLKEAIGINQSLTCLGRVIDALVENKPHIPYRDSVLTCLLADSLGGNSRTSMVAALSPAAVNYDETLSTLRYASRARRIINRIKVNEDPAAALIRELQEELAKMREGVLTGMGVPGGFGEGGMATEAEMAERTAEVQEALAKLQELQARDEVAEQEREMKWEAERQRIQQKHELEMTRLKQEQDELEQQKVELEEQHVVLREEIDMKRKAHIMNMFKHGAQISMEKQKRDQTIEQQKKLRHELIVQRFRSASQRARLQALEEEAARAGSLKARATHLEQELQAAKRQTEVLELQILRSREYDPKDLTDPRNPIHMAGMPTGEEVVYDGPLCDMCLEQPAQYRCTEAPCSGDLYCVWCDANQHRRADKRKHKRQPLAAPCECCGAREAQFMCPGCDNLRLCQTCDDHKHGAHRRSNIISVGCDFCNLRQAEVACLDCPAKSCPACDEVIHRATRRQDHRRHYQEFTSPNAKLEQHVPPPKILREPSAAFSRMSSHHVDAPRQPSFAQQFEPEFEPQFVQEPEVPFAQDPYHSYIPERPPVERFTGPKEKTAVQWHGGANYAVRDVEVLGHRQAAEEPPPAPAPPTEPPLPSSPPRRYSPPVSVPPVPPPAALPPSDSLPTL
eukprot:EG_transcript_2649